MCLLLIFGPPVEVSKYLQVSFHKEQVNTLHGIWELRPVDSFITLKSHLPSIMWLSDPASQNIINVTSSLPQNLLPINLAEW